MNVFFSLLLVVLCGVLWELGAVFQKKAADRLPLLELGKGLPSLMVRFVGSPLWLLGLVLSGAGWGFFTVALVSVPVSVARAATGSGYVFLALFSMVILRQKLTALEWGGILAVTMGIMFLGISEKGARDVTVISPVPLVGTLLVTSVACSAIMLARKKLSPIFQATGVFGIAAGIWLGSGDILTKVFVTLLTEKGPLAFLVISAVGFAFFYLTGFFILSRAYQHGTALFAVSVSDLSTRFLTLLVGFIALGEKMPSTPVLVFLKIAGFAAAFTGTYMLGKFGANSVSSAWR